jgi:hypothetical protein
MIHTSSKPFKDIKYYRTLVIRFSQLYLMIEPTHENAVSRQFAHITGTKFPNLGSNTVLLHEWLLSKVELKRVIR